MNRQEGWGLSAHLPRVSVSHQPISKLWGSSSIERGDRHGADNEEQDGPSIGGPGGYEIDLMVHVRCRCYPSNRVESAPVGRPGNPGLTQFERKGKVR